MLLASKKRLDKREKGLLTSQFEQLGLFSDMSASRLSEYASLAWVFLAYREYGQWEGDWQYYIDTSISCHGVTCLGKAQYCWDRNHTLSNKPSRYTLATCTWLCLVDCIQKTLRQKRGRTSYFTLVQLGWFSDMSASRLPEYISPSWEFLAYCGAVNGTVTGNVTGIFCHKVTWLGTDQCCWDRNHKQWWFMTVPQYLLRVSNKPSPYTLATCTWLCLADCIQKTLGQETGIYLTCRGCGYKHLLPQGHMSGTDQCCWIRNLAAALILAVSFKEKTGIICQCFMNVHQYFTCL